MFLVYVFLGMSVTTDEREEKIRPVAHVIAVLIEDDVTNQLTHLLIRMLKHQWKLLNRSIIKCMLSSGLKYHLV